MMFSLMKVPTSAAADTNKMSQKNKIESVRDVKKQKVIL
jgi:hypothetical protein